MLLQGWAWISQAPLHPGPHPGLPPPPPPCSCATIAEEGGVGQVADQAAVDQTGSGERQQQPQQQQEHQQQLQLQKEQEEEQQAVNAYKQLQPMQSAATTKTLQPRSAHQQKHLPASSEAQLLSEAPLVEQGFSDVSGIDDGDSDADAADRAVPDKSHLLQEQLLLPWATSRSQTELPHTWHKQLFAGSQASIQCLTHVCYWLPDMCLPVTQSYSSCTEHLWQLVQVNHLLNCTCSHTLLIPAVSCHV